MTGKICSGKSTVLKAISEEIHWPIISFGSYVRHIAQGRMLPSKRNIYQALGAELYQTLGPKKFLIEVMRFHLKSDQENILFDGVRHESILKEIQNAFNIIYIIFLNADVKLRYKRLPTKRSNSEEKLSFEEFLKIDNHPVEVEIESLRKQANVIIDSSKPLKEILSEIHEFISEQILGKG
ncbi:MAG: AAA family ATPase [Thermodesulfobacteriota bacterium]